MISLYAIGGASIEVGKFNGTMEEAKDFFIGQITEHGIDISLVNIDIQESSIRFTIPFRFADWELLERVANIADSHADAPDVYILKAPTAAPGYTKTGWYND